MKRPLSIPSKLANALGPWASAKTFADRLGVGRKKIKNARHNATTRVCKDFCWDHDDAQKFAESIGLPLVPPAMSDKVLLTVRSHPGRKGFQYGKHNFQATTPAGEIVSVRVTDSSKFRQKLHNGEPICFWGVSRCDDGPLPHYLLAGRAPRRPGIW